MAKSLLVALLFSTFQSTFTPVFAENESAPFSPIDLKANYCDAPAPDDFHVVSIGTDLVTLGWVPAWVGANHSLEISIEDSGTWLVLFTNPNVPGESYVLNSLDPGHYRARIATNCPTGEASTIMSELLFDFKIIDLTTDGRIPVNPVPVEDCSYIEFWKYEWVGFRVKEIGTGISNLFEINLTEGQWYEHAYVRRVYENPIVAVDMLGHFPIIGGISFNVSSPFRMDDKSKPDPIIGYITLSRNIAFPAVPIITLCKVLDDPTKPWKPEYEFTALTAESAIIVGTPSNSGAVEKTVRDTIDFDKFKAQNPFKGSVNIFAPRTQSGCGKTTFRLLNTKAQIVLMYELDLYGSQVSFPTSSLLPGVYVLHIENECESQTLKLVKSE